MTPSVHVHSRRGFLARTLGAIWSGASVLEQAFLRAAQARAQSKDQLPTLFDIEKTADGVYAAIARPRAIINCNAVIFENSRDLLIVDAHAAPSAVFALVAQIRREVTPKPVRYVVTTHLHGDHSQGLPAYRQLAPSSEIISSTTTREAMAALNPSRVKAALDAMPRSIENYRERLAAAKSPEGRAYYGEMISQTRAFLDEMRSWEIELPTMTFESQLILHDKSHDLHLAFRGRGHTAGDIVVFCPQNKVVASGDLFHGFLPAMGDGYPRDWPGTLRAVKDFPFEHAAGGHGGVQHTRERLDQLRGYLEELVEAVSRGKQEGRSLEQMQQAITPASLKAIERGGYGDYVVGEIKRHDFRVSLASPVEVLARGVRDNVASVFRTLDRR
jgi:cyclase